MAIIGWIASAFILLFGVTMVVARWKVAPYLQSQGAEALQATVSTWTCPSCGETMGMESLEAYRPRAKDDPLIEVRYVVICARCGKCAYFGEVGRVIMADVEKE